jgi:FtsH-binding integral membrane protein
LAQRYRDKTNIGDTERRKEKKVDAKAANNPSSEARRGQQRTSRYSTQVAGVLVAAFTISALYAVISTLSGVIQDANNPILWIFYVVGFGLAALACMDKSWT